MRRAYVVIGVALGIGAVLLLAIYASLPADTQAELRQAVGEATIGLFPVAIFGVIVNELIRQRDEEQAQAAKVRDARRQFRDRAIVAYNESKMVRRMLRGAGFGPSMAQDPTPAMLEMLDDQMRALSRAQLQFDQLKRESKASSAAFTRAKTIEELLGKIEQALNRVIDEWERGRARLEERPVRTWKRFSDFVADKDVSEQGLRAVFHELEHEVLAELKGDVVPAGSSPGRPDPGVAPTA